jgi:hypothetical protein
VGTNTAVDGQDYYVVRDGAGLFLCIEKTGTGDTQEMVARGATAWWSPEFRAAARWYRGMPDRVHLFCARGEFQGEWYCGLKVALMFLEMRGGHLVYCNGQTDQPYDGQFSVSRPGRSVWEWLRTPAV